MGLWDKDEKKTDGLWADKDKSEKGGLWGKEPERERNPGTGIWDKRIHLPEQYGGEFSTLLFGNYHAGSAYDSDLSEEFNGPPSGQQQQPSVLQNHPSFLPDKKEEKKKPKEKIEYPSVVPDEADQSLLEGAGEAVQRYKYGDPFLSGGLNFSVVDKFKPKDELNDEDAVSKPEVKDRWGKLPITQADVEKILKMLKEFSLERDRKLKAQEIKKSGISKKELILWALGIVAILFFIIWFTFFSD